jgi:hypothetical protein
MKGFSPKWITWVETLITKLDWTLFQTKKGLRQGDSFSPLLCNILADMLTILINRAKEDG